MQFLQIWMKKYFGKLLIYMYILINMYLYILYDLDHCMTFNLFKNIRIQSEEFINMSSSMASTADFLNSSHS